MNTHCLMLVAHKIDMVAIKNSFCGSGLCSQSLSIAALEYQTVIRSVETGGRRRKVIEQTLRAITVATSMKWVQSLESRATKTLHGFIDPMRWSERSSVPTDTWRPVSTG